MTEYIKEPHTAMFIGQTKCVKTHLVLELIENQYNKHFGYIIIICPTVWWNKVYHSKNWLYQWIEKLSQLLAHSQTLFIIDDIIVDKSLDKRRQSLLELTISNRHRGHYLWLLTQFYTAIPKNLRRQAKAIFVWYPKERGDLKAIHEGNDVLTDNELIVAKKFLKKIKI